MEKHLLSSFNFPRFVTEKLSNARLTVVDELKGMKPSELSKLTSLSHKESLKVLQTIRNEMSTNVSKASTVFDILQEQHRRGQITTFCRSLDDMLGGGVPVASITEICGAPGVGKTQLSFQLCVDVQIPEELGGLNGDAVFIDTEGSFIVRRLSDIVKATIDHCKQTVRSRGSTSYDVIKDFTEENILKRIYYYRCRNHTELVSAVHLLPTFLNSHSKVKLILVDSIAFPFRYDFDDYALRNRLLNSLSQSFIRLATERHLAVVLINQMTTKIQGNKSKVVPALGESWGHSCTTRVIMNWNRQERWASIYKSASRPEGVVARYQITTAGIRDCITDDVTDDEMLPSLLCSQHHDDVMEQQTPTQMMKVMDDWMSDTQMCRIVDDERSSELVGSESEHFEASSSPPKKKLKIW